VWRGFRFDYDEVYPDAAEPVQVFGVGASSPDPHVMRDNLVDGPYPFIKWLSPSVVAENNSSAAVAPVRFRDFMGAYLDEDYRRIEWWTARATLSPDQRAVVYPAGALALQGGTIYEALAENQEKEPAANPDVWRALPAPADDVRLAPGSPHAGLGVRWPPPAR